MAATLLLPAPAHAEVDWNPLTAIDWKSVTHTVTHAVTRSAAVGFDIVVLRPLAVVTTGVGFALALPTALLSVHDGNDEVWQQFVVEPAKNVYERPLGEF